MGTSIARRCCGFSNSTETRRSPVYTPATTPPDSPPTQLQSHGVPLLKTTKRRHNLLEDTGLTLPCVIGAISSHGKLLVPVVYVQNAHYNPAVQTNQLNSDDDSFGLLNESFDAMEGAEDAFGIGRDDAMFSPSKADGEKDHGQGNLTPESKNSDDNISMGDISPIKLIYNNDASAPNHPGTTQIHHGASVVPVDWRNEHQPGQSPYPVTSNPTKVLKTVRSSFNGMKYRLPFLKLSACVSPGATGGFQDEVSTTFNTPYNITHTIARKRRRTMEM